jgi:uncharacterized membrane protein
VATSALGTRERNSAARPPLDPRPFERVLAGAALLLLVVVAAALARGVASGEATRVPPVIWFHVATIGIALALTPVMMLRRRGDRPHRALGWIWVLAMAATAVASFFVRTINPGGFSLIHILSAWTLIQLPLIVLSARRHRHAAHRRSVIGMVTGALIIAGLFTFPQGRLLGHWLFG